MPCLHLLQRALLKASGAPRIYSAALGASFPHFHAHMVPGKGNTLHGYLHHRNQPNEKRLSLAICTSLPPLSVYGEGLHKVTGTAWDVFLQEKLAADGKIQVQAGLSPTSYLVKSFHCVIW